MSAESLPLAKPSWLRVRLGGGPNYSRMNHILKEQRLRTVCDEALCPNKGRCWEHGHATVIILGDVCTRGCLFCNVTPGSPGGCDADEPMRVAHAVKTMGVKEIVVTSVTRDDLPDGGATIWAETVHRIRKAVPGIVVEVLIPDFGGNQEALDRVFAERPDVMGHNLETVPSLYPKVRSKADYRQSLGVLTRSKSCGLVTKTSLMLGLGETGDEVMAVLKDALTAGCDIVYLGQYLQPSKRHVPVARYVEPSEFAGYRTRGLEMGFKVVISSPLVRSSFHSDEQSAFLASLTLRGRTPMLAP